jgi:glycosyltransferase involved in cell wall biosynthesis
MSALEALAAGVPILVSEGIPVGQLAAPANAGKVVPCDPDLFSKAAIQLLADPPLLSAMGQQGRKLARENFDIQVISRNLLDQLQHISETGVPKI